jgi:hypothetical protein
MPWTMKTTVFNGILRVKQHAHGLGEERGGRPSTLRETCHDSAAPISLGASLLGENVSVDVGVCHLKMMKPA